MDNGGIGRGSKADAEAAADEAAAAAEAAAVAAAADRIPELVCVETSS